VGHKDFGIWSEALSEDQIDLQFGKLERVSAQAGWPHEELAFTPWLAAHVELLGEAVGLALSLEAHEHPVGRYCSPTAPGTDAEVVIWIAERLNSEHVAALE
jgi:hypothetical protein